MASNVEPNGGGSKYLYYLSGFSARAGEASAIQDDPSSNSRSWESRSFTPAALHDALVLIAKDKPKHADFDAYELSSGRLGRGD